MPLRTGVSRSNTIVPWTRLQPPGWPPYPHNPPPPALLYSAARVSWLTLSQEFPQYAWNEVQILHLVGHACLWRPGDAMWRVASRQTIDRGSQLLSCETVATCCTEATPPISCPQPMTGHRRCTSVAHSWGHRLAHEQPWLQGSPKGLAEPS